MGASPCARPHAAVGDCGQCSHRRSSEGFMSHNDSSRLARRGFLGRLSGAAAGLITITPSMVLAGPTPTPGPSGGPDAWIDRLTGTDRVVFHAHRNLSPGL